MNVYLLLPSRKHVRLRWTDKNVNTCNWVIQFMLLSHSACANARVDMFVSQTLVALRWVVACEWDFVSVLYVYDLNKYSFNKLKTFLTSFSLNFSFFFLDNLIDFVCLCNSTWQYSWQTNFHQLTLTIGTVPKLYASFVNFYKIGNKLHIRVTFIIGIF